ncbi:patatin-like phospholipase family protein [Anabaena sp. PCC 7108]|uniref:patatin-like phospholipase family protein n=1 Tax=Anabaena sp. PCC 7108 TaxID=163908 RepID=UPI00034A5491|nr:patatin-like phospholipase family protein [Anabaena sp. PCC 7108]
MSQKLAIAISGAVSLGSYEAGVMYEVLEAIAQYNEKREKDDPNRIEIDVITGASAGGMTAGILAQKLLCDGDSLRKPYENPLYKAWIEDVDIEELLEVPKEIEELLEVPKENYKNSLLSSKVVADIGKKYLLDNPPSPNKLHPSTAQEIFVGIAMSNLNGWDYTVNPRNQEGDGKFIYTRYKDGFVCRLQHNSDDSITLAEMSLEHTKNDAEWTDIDKTNWEMLRECSLSSGVFPLAFEVKEIRRVPGKGEFENRENKDYYYTDGGVFENEPLGIAKKLAEWVDNKAIKENPQNEPNKRFYLYVAPGNKTSTANVDFGKNGIDLWTTLNALLAAVFNQARFQDWIIKDLDDTSPIFQITTKDENLIGELFSAFAGFLDIRFRFYDYNIGRESARKGLEKFSEKTSNPNLAYWTEANVEDKDQKLLWEFIDTEGIKQSIDQHDYREYAKKNSIDQLLDIVDIKKRNKILEALLARFRQLIKFVSEKIDGEEEKKRPFLGLDPRDIFVKIAVDLIVKPVLQRKLFPK